MSMDIEDYRPDRLSKGVHDVQTVMCHLLCMLCTFCSLVLVVAR